MNRRGGAPHRGAPGFPPDAGGRRGWRVRPLVSVVSLVVAVALLAPLLQPPRTVFAADGETADLPPGVAILQTRVRLSRSVPIFPANTARYFRGGYATPVGAVVVYLTETAPTTGVPPVDAAQPIVPACTRIDIVRHNSALEVLPPDGSAGADRYRIFIVPSEPLSEVTEDGVCAFAAGFVAAFTFFLEADADRGRELSFSGNRTPEFPAVIEINN